LIYIIYYSIFSIEVKDIFLKKDEMFHVKHFIFLIRS